MDIKLVELQAKPVLSIRTRTNIKDMPKTIGEGYTKIAAYMQEIGEQPKEMPFVAYYNMDMQDMDIEIGFPVSKELPGKDDIQPSETMAGNAVMYVYKGAYSGMEPVYNEIFKWMDENGHQPQGVFYEYYYNSPGEVPESELLTRIVVPVK